MVLPPVTLEDLGGHVTLCDERDRAARGPMGATPGSVASVTLESRDTSWGEFLTWREVLAAHAFLGAIIASEHAQGRQ